jgi:hypothetical protein
MLAATYRLRIGSRIRQLALLTAIGAVLHTCERVGVPLASWHRDHLDGSASVTTDQAEIHRASAHSYHGHAESAQDMEP